MNLRVVLLFWVLSLILTGCEKHSTKPACSPASKCLPTDLRSELGLKNTVITWTYDEAGKLTRKFFSPISSYLSAYSDYSYDAGGKLTSLKRTHSGHAGLGAWEHTYEYDARERLVKRGYYTLIESPESTQRLIRQTQEPIQYDLYEYNELGQRIKMQTFREDGTAVYPHETYEYDDRGNLVNVYLHSPGSSYPAVSYEYDNKNNMFLWEPDTGDSPVTAVKARALTIPTRHLYPRSPNNVIKYSWYDAAGNEMGVARYRYEYNAQCFPVKRVEDQENAGGAVYMFTYLCR